MDKTATLPFLSIVICTHNRAHLLPILFASIAQQQYPTSSREILLVDNASTDDTRLVTEKFSKTIPGLRYLYEREIGLSNARNRGYRETLGLYVGFLDDDSRIPPDWLSVAAEIILSNDPPVFGGSFSAFYLSSKPKWFKEEYGSRGFGSQSRYIDVNEYLFGGNMFIRRSILESMEGFDPNFGMKGKLIGYGEETDLQEKIRKREGDDCFYYDPRLCIEHLVRPEKMKWSWIIRQKFADGRDYYNLFPDRKEPISVFRLSYRIIKFIILLILDLLFRVIFRERKRYPYFQNYYYEHTTKYIAAFGELAEQVKEKVHHAGK